MLKTLNTHNKILHNASRIFPFIITKNIPAANPFSGRYTLILAWTIDHPVQATNLISVAYKQSHGVFRLCVICKGSHDIVTTIYICMVAVHVCMYVCLYIQLYVHMNAYMYGPVSKEVAMNKL